MGIREVKDDLRGMADDANGAARVLWGRDIKQGEDIPQIAAAYVARGQRAPGGSRGLDERIGIRSAIAAMWQANGGATFVLSESVAASIALTKTPGGVMRMCLPAFAIEIPAGYMPSVKPGMFPGLVLVSRGPGRVVLADCYVDRGDAGGYRLVMLTDDADEETRGQDLDDVENAVNAGEQTPRWYHRAITRLVRGTMMWVEAFPAPPVGGGSHSKGEAFGLSVNGERGHVYLKTVSRSMSVCGTVRRRSFAAGLSSEPG